MKPFDPRMVVRFFLSVLAFCAALGSCAAQVSCALVPDPRPAERISVAAWNVQNLFDEVDDGGEYPEFDPERGWTRGQFWTRCGALAQVVRTLAEGGPDVLVLEEVEGAHALEVLASRFLADQRYAHSFLAPAAVPGVKTAFLSRFPFLRTGLHYPSDPGAGPGEASLRPLVEVEIDLGGRSLVLIGNHWKSRIPSPAATEGQRRESAKVLARRIGALEALSPAPFIVALGDFNTSLELSRNRPDRSLIPGGAYDGTASGLVVFEGREAALLTRWPGAVWDPWDTVVSPPGSYVYQGDWNRLDHAFVAASSLRLTDWRFENFRAAAFAAEPLAYGPRTPQGISDHFPVVLTLVRRPQASRSP